jgi:hypothetical protein
MTAIEGIIKKLIGSKTHNLSGKTSPYPGSAAGYAQTIDNNQCNGLKRVYIKAHE